MRVDATKTENILDISEITELRKTVEKTRSDRIRGEDIKK